jgi:Amt family ammonium transporter
MEINYGDTAWMLMATILVFLMTPAGLALFYGGLSNKRNVINTVGMSFVSMCVATIAWITFGYTMAFSDESFLYFGSFKHAFLNDISVNDVTGTIPTLLFVTFQGVFAAIAVAIISGSVVERIKFSTWVVFATLWVLFIYAPLANWIWGEGLLHELGELDFAGGTVIHVNAGVAGLVLALMLGKRKNHKENNEPSSLKLTALGAALLWFGWFGFNAGSQLAADGIAANAILVSNVAACTGGLVWMMVEWMTDHKPSLLGLASGVIAGLVGITPAAGYVDVAGALTIGGIAGWVGYFGVVKLKRLLQYDDTLDAFGIHGLVGIWGAIATGIFANPSVNGEAGLLYGNPSQVLVQLIATLITIVFTSIGTFLIFKLSTFVTKGARVEEHIEQQGIDIAYHKERSFADGQ